MAELEQSLGACPVMGVFRGLSPAETVALATRAWDLGVVNVEVPIESRAAIPALEQTVAAGAARGMDVGAGTIVSPSHVRDAIAAGARYGVSPGLDSDLIAYAAGLGFPMIPGVATASEILVAQGLGLRWIKAFPASVLGAAWIAAMKGPFPEMNFIATGGVTGANASQFLTGGAAVVGVGSAFGKPEETTLLRELIRRDPAGAE